jgi:hypothetical protein
MIYNDIVDDMSALFYFIVHEAGLELTHNFLDLIRFLYNIYGDPGMKLYLFGDLLIEKIIEIVNT